MKKYSSYTNLKLASSPRALPNQYWPRQAQIPSTRRAVQIPLMVISKEPYAIPMTTKYSAGFLQKQKLFSSKKENKDITNVTNIKVSNNNTPNIGGYKLTHQSKLTPVHQNKVTLLNTRPVSSKNIKKDDKDRSSKKEKSSRVEKCLEIDQNFNYQKQNRYDVQSPKTNARVKDQSAGKKEKSKTKFIQENKDKDKTTHRPGSIAGNVKKQEQKRQEKLDEYVTKYDPQPKNLLIHCTSEAQLSKPISLQQKKPLTGYYKSALINAFFTSKNTSFHQICRSHLTSSIQFLTYVKKNRKMIPSNPIRVNLPPSSRKTLIFDLDQTLIHCNESTEKPHDVSLDITFPNNSKIKAAINVRPYASECLRELSKYFEIIIFTASHECYANVIIDYLDPKRQYVSHRFFRETCHRTEQGFYVKDLRVFGRDLSNVLLIDNAAYSYCFQPQNGVPIIPFYNNKADLQLKELTNYLKQLIECRSMRSKNEQYMRLSDYHFFTGPQELINQLYY